MTPCTTLCKLEGDCEGELRNYIVTGKDGEPVPIEALTNPVTGKPVTVQGASTQLCDKHYLYLDSARQELVISRVEDPVIGFLRHPLIGDDEDDEKDWSPF